MKDAGSVALLVGSVVLSSLAQLLLKMGVTAGRQSSPVSLESLSLMSLTNALMHPLVVAGLFAYVGSMLGWLIVLSRFDLGYAYPFVALGIVLTTLLAWLFQGEMVSQQRMLGVAIIVVGVLVVARS